MFGRGETEDRGGRRHPALEAAAAVGAYPKRDWDDPNPMRHKAHKLAIASDIIELMSDRVRQLRKEAGLSQSELAARGTGGLASDVDLLVARPVALASSRLPRLLRRPVGCSVSR